MFISRRTRTNGGLVFPRSASDGAGEVSAELQSIPSAHSLTYTDPQNCCFFTLSVSFTRSTICILHVRAVCTIRRCSIVLAALVSYPQTRRKRSQRDEDKLDGAATWAALCLIFFIIINSPLLLLRSHISPLLMCH